MKGRKGISLPIEMIVVVAVAVLVLMVIIAFFVSGSGAQMSLISDQEAITRGCTAYVLIYHCDFAYADRDSALVKISGYSAACSGPGGTLKDACCKAGFTAQDCIVNVCRCMRPS